jgi:hypothetical protein
MNRLDLKRIPAKLVVGAASLYAKEKTSIGVQLVYEGVDVGSAGIGPIDKRDSQSYFRITITPDGRLTATEAGVLLPYGNPTIGTGIFTNTDVPATIHGNDASKDIFTAVALEKQPEMYFHPTKSLLGSATFLALHGNNLDWSDAASLRTDADTAGVFADTTYTNAGIILQNYTLGWTAITGFTTATDFYDGLTFQPSVSFVDDNPARTGLLNKRISGAGGILRGIPMSVTRQNILAAAKLQNTGAVRGGSRAASKAADITITGADGKVYLLGKNAALTEIKAEWGVEQLREGEVAWQFFPTITAGVRGAWWTTPLA